MTNFIFKKILRQSLKVLVGSGVLFIIALVSVPDVEAMCDPVGEPCSVLECASPCPGYPGSFCQYCYSTGTCVENEDGTTGCDIEYDCNAWEEDCKDGCPCSGPSDDGCDEKDPKAPVCNCASCFPGMNSTIKSYVVNFEWQATTDWGEGCPNDNKYKVYLREAGSGTWSGTKVCEVGEDTTSCSFNLCNRYGGDCSQALGKSYEWKVRADNGPRDADSGTCSFSVADDTVAPTGDLDVPEKVCPFLDSEVTTAFSGDTYPNVAELVASNIIDHPGDDAWGTSVIFFFVVMDDLNHDRVGDDVEEDGWGQFDWWPQTGDPDYGTYFFGWENVDPPAKGPISHSVVWDNSTTFGGSPRHLNDLEPGSTYSVRLHLRDKAGNINGSADAGIIEIACPGFIQGYVWEELIGAGYSLGVRDAGENISGSAALTLQNLVGQEEVLDPLGFNVAVEESLESDEYRIKVEPSTCFCPVSGYNKYWNNSPDPYTGSGISYDEPYDDLFYANLGSVASMETKYAWLGVQHADFSVNLPTGPLMLDPGFETTEVMVTTRVLGDCWAPDTAEVEFSTATSGVSGGPGVSLVGFASDATGCNAPSSTIRLDPESDTENAGWACLNVDESSVDYDETYTLTVTGTGTEPCLGSHSDSVNFNVELLTWFQTEGGNVYSKRGIFSYIPEKANLFREDPPDRFLAAPYFSLPYSSAGLVISSSGPHSWGEGRAYDLGGDSGWEVKDYGELKFYDSANARYDYDYYYFDNMFGSKTADCGSGVMGDGGVGGCTTVSSGSLLKVAGDLVVNNDNGFDDKAAAVIVNGDVLFTGDFAPDGSYAFVSSGSIRVQAGVENVRAFLVADQSIYDYNEDTDDREEFENQEAGLWLRGSAIAFGYDNDEALVLRRTRIGEDEIEDTADDDLEPANYFSWDPELIIDLTQLLGRDRVTWRELN
ncbi:MAG: hypothetical protein U9M98_00890 [Patescibacteria group bacterium]|nr:hypothetical protein [Patescibacteria group bacterium]